MYVPTQCNTMAFTLNPFKSISKNRTASLIRPAVRRNVCTLPSTSHSALIRQFEYSTSSCGPRGETKGQVNSQLGPHSSIAGPFYFSPYGFMRHREKKPSYARCRTLSQDVGSGFLSHYCASRGPRGLGLARKMMQDKGLRARSWYREPNGSGGRIEPEYIFIKWDDIRN